MVRTLVQAMRMPRLLPMSASADRGIATEQRETLHVRGPPVLSLGRCVVNAPMPCAFVYAQGWQGFIYGGRETKVRCASSA